MREIIAVFQDCVLCGVEGRQKIADYARDGIIIRKVGFTTEEGSELIHEAVFKHRIGSMPFFVEGDRFAQTLGELLEKPTKEPKIVKRLQKKAVLKKETGDGVDSKD